MYTVYTTLISTSIIILNLIMENIFVTEIFILAEANRINWLYLQLGICENPKLIVLSFLTSILLY